MEWVIKLQEKNVKVGVYYIYRPASMYGLYVMYVTSRFHVRSIRYVEVGTLRIFLYVLYSLVYLHC